jgi:hypothetical protein
MTALLMVEPDVGRGSSMDRMSYVIHGPAVAVIPRLGYTQRPTVVLEEGPSEFCPRLSLEGDRVECSISNKRSESANAPFHVGDAAGMSFAVASE